MSTVVRNDAIHRPIRIAATALTCIVWIAALWFGWRLLYFSGNVLLMDIALGTKADELVVVNTASNISEKFFKKGDRVLELNSIPVRTELEFELLLQRRSVSNEYLVTLQREGVRYKHPIGLTAFKLIAPGIELTSLIPVFAFSGIGLLLVYLRPDLISAQLAYLTCWLTAIYNLMFFFGRTWTAPWAQWERHALHAAEFISPFHLFTAYYFFLFFPMRLNETIWLRRMRYWVFGINLVVLIAIKIPYRLLYWAPETWLPSILEWQRFPIFSSLGALSNIALFLSFIVLLWFNYRSLESLDSRHRLRYVLAATGLAVIAEIANTFDIPSYDRTSTYLPQNILKFVLAQSSVIIPISVAYTILRYRVVGFAEFLRIGLQYLLFRKSLRFLPFVPIPILILIVIQHQHLTLGDLILEPTIQINLAFLFAGYFMYQNLHRIEQRLVRMFFGETLSRERILEHLLKKVSEATDEQQLSQILNSEIEGAFHPSMLMIFLYHPHSGAFEAVSRSGEAEPGLLSRIQQWLSSKITLGEVSPIVEYFDGAEQYLGIPMYSVEQIRIGAIVLGAKRTEELYTEEDKETLIGIAQQAGLILERFRLMGEVKQHERIQKDVFAPLMRDQFGIFVECPRCGKCFDAQDVICDCCHAALQHSIPIVRVIQNRYRIDQLLGKGGMGAVYLAKDLSLQRDVALKVILGRHLGNSSVQRRFAREASVLARLDHKNIVRIFDFGDLKSDGAFLVMEILRGITLRSHIPLLQGNPGAASQILQGLFEGLAYAHSCSVIHRDLKPENCFLAKTAGNLHQQEVKLLDFGLAKVTGLPQEDQAALTSAGVAMGTWGYMPPEQFSNANVDARVDQFALGVISLEVLTGSLHRDERLAVAALPGIIERKFAELPASWRELSKPILRATSYQREERYSSVEAFAADLLPALAGAEVVPQSPNPPRDADNATISL